MHLGLWRHNLVVGLDGWEKGGGGWSGKGGGMGLGRVFLCMILGPVERVPSRAPT